MSFSSLQAAQKAWATTSLSERARLLSKLRHAVLGNAERLCDVLTAELGKVRTEALVLDVAVSALTLSWTSASSSALASSVIEPYVPALPRRATSTWKPRGVCALLSPWNYPLAIPMGTIAPALLGGNGVLWKPSEHALSSSRELLAVLRAAGLPHDLVQIEEGGADAGERVLSLPVDHVTFVGSTSAGRKVAATCGARLLPHIVELGGKAAAIVGDDADIERAARAIVYGGLANGGQSCVAVEVVIATAGIFDALFARTKELARALRPGVELCRPVLAQQAERAAAEAARFGGGLVVDVSGERTWLATDDVFGAVVPFLRVADLDLAFGLAAQQQQQLASYVFGPAAARRVHELRAPMVAVDDVMLHYGLPWLPFGGVGASGYGRVHGVEGIRALCVQQIVLENTLPITPKQEPWWQPYDRDPAPFMGTLDKTLALLERLRRK